MVTDMGSEFIGETFEQITELGVTLISLPAFRPDLKGPIEKLFDMVQEKFKDALKGKGVIMPDFQERGAHDYRKDACLTLEEFERIVVRCIVYYNSERVISDYPYTDEMIQEQVRPYACDNSTTMSKQWTVFCDRWNRQRFCEKGCLLFIKA